MYTLAIDTSSPNLSYCIQKNGRIIYEYNRALGKRASLLVYKLEKTFKRLSLNLKAFDRFVVGAGPGSFTGLRISFSVIKAFALVTKKPVFFPASFFSCAYPFRNKEKKIAVISDARKGLIYVASFVFGEKELKQEEKPVLMSLPDCIKAKKEYFFLTYDLNLCQEILSLNSKISFYSKKVYPKAKYLINSIDQLRTKKADSDLSNLKPLYLHPLSYQVAK